MTRIFAASLLSIFATSFVAVPVLAQPAPPPPGPAPAAPPAQPAPPPPAAPAPTPPPGPGAAPSPEAPPALEQSAPVQGTEAQTPAQAAASVEVGAQVAVPAPAPAADDDLVPPGEKDTFKARPIDPAGLEYRPGRGLTIKSADGDFELTTRLRSQFLYTATHTSSDDTMRQVFEIRRFRVSMGGNAFGVHNKFYLELGFGPREDQLPLTSGEDPGRVIGSPSTSPLVDAYAEFDYLRDLTLRIGQYKPSYGRQRVMSDGNLSFVEVSEATREFTFDRDVGFDFRSKDLFGLNLLRYSLGMYTGEGKDGFGATKFQMLYLARLEILPLGLFEDYQEADFERSKPRLGIGVTAAHFDRARRMTGSLGAIPTDGGTTDFNHFEADAIFKVAGLAVQSEFFLRKGDRNDDGANAADGLQATRDGFGWYAQAGYLIPRVPFEIAGRYGMVHGKTEAGHDGLRDTSEAGGALSYYFARHPLKLQADFFHVWDKDDSSLNRDVFRLQLQTSL